MTDNGALFWKHLRAAILRAQELKGGRQLSYLLDLSKGAIGKILTGGKTNAEVPWRLLRADPTALDEIGALFGVEIIPAQPDIEHGDALAVLAEITALLAACPKPSHQDLLRLEPKLREGAAALKTLLARVRAIRGGAL